MSDTLEIFGDEFTNVTGIKAVHIHELVLLGDPFVKCITDSTV